MALRGIQLQYFGGKARISKPLAEFLNGELDEEQPFVDAFCGSCNVISKINRNRLRVANDKHEYLIAMWVALQNGWIPPENVSKEDYYYVKNNPDEDKALTGFIGFGCSFAGKWWGGYAKCKNRNYASNAKNSCEKKIGRVSDVQFNAGDYTSVEIPYGSLVYCDIPYKDTTKYTTGDFNYEDFYSWCKRLEINGNQVFVSEYAHNVPEDAKVVFSIKSKQDIRNRENGKKTTEEVVFRFL